jgi:hypothetical protein
LPLQAPHHLVELLEGAITDTECAARAATITDLDHKTERV